MNLTKALLIIVEIIFLILLIRCTSSKSQDTEKLLEEWIGKEIQIPTSLRYIHSSKESDIEPEYTLIAYYDANGCTGCKMMLKQWNELMNYLNPNTDYKNIRLLIVAHSRNKKELDYLVKDSGFRYDLAMDAKNDFFLLNSIPASEDFHFMLLDHLHRVILIGNPVLNKKIYSLYTDLLSSLQDTPEIEHPSYTAIGLGRIRAGIVAKHTIQLKNELPDTLLIDSIITSCECTKGEISSTCIPPNKNYSLEISYRDSIPGSFSRTVTIKAKNDIIKKFILSGEIIK